MKHLTITKFVIIGLIVLIDQWTKYLAIDHLSNPVHVAEITPFMNFFLVWNDGVSFGLFQGQTPWIMMGITATITIIFIVWMWRTENQLLCFAFAFIIGGAIGNLVDRLHHGAVVDFIDLHVSGYHYPVFNLADSAITVGAGLLLIDFLLGGKKELS